MKEKGTPDLSGSLLPDRLQYSLKIEGHGRVQLDLELDPRMQVPAVEKDAPGNRSQTKPSKNVSMDVYHFDLVQCPICLLTKINSTVIIDTFVS